MQVVYVQCITLPLVRPSVPFWSAHLYSSPAVQEALDSSIEELGQTFEIKFYAPVVAGKRIQASFFSVYLRLGPSLPWATHAATTGSVLLPILNHVPCWNLSATCMGLTALG